MPDRIRHVSLTASDFLDDRQYRGWDARLCGAYCNLIFQMYADEGRLEDSPEALQRIAQWHGEGWPEAWTILRKKFKVRRKFIYHKRVTAELRRAREHQQVKHLRAVKGARTRWGKQCSSNAQAMPSEVKGSEVIASWDGKRFTVSEEEWIHWEALFPNVPRSAMQAEIAACEEKYAGSEIKKPWLLLRRWMANAFKQYQDDTEVKDGIDLKKHLGIDDGIEPPAES